MTNAEPGRDDELKRVIHEQVEAVLSPISVVSVTLEDDEDAYGDPMLHVIVVYAPNDAQPEISGLVRQLRPALEEQGEDRFPVMSFIAAEEAEAYFAAT